MLSLKSRPSIEVTLAYSRIHDFETMKTLTFVLSLTKTDTDRGHFEVRTISIRKQTLVLSLTNTVEPLRHFERMKTSSIARTITVSKVKGSTV